ncbi:flippase-like domain-containing protein [Candidatus Binatia bacterium]|nr:flippase-like domain-containing protein [Candidatus Binatia bacterium]
MKAFLQIAFSVAVSAAAVWYSLQGVNFDQFISDFGAAKVAWLVPMVATAVLAMLLRAWRWRVILETLAPLEKTPVLHATNIGFMGNMVLPLRAGEVLKPLVVARAGEVGAPAALASVAVERICDLLMLAVLAVVTVGLVPGDNFLRSQLPALSGAVAGMIVILALMVVYREPVQKLADWISEYLPKFLGEALRDASRGGLRVLSGLTHPASFLAVMAISTGVWLAAAGGFVFGALALDIEAPYFALGIATSVIVAVAVSVPSAPGFIGVFWAGSEIALGLFGVDRSLAFSFGVLNWLVQMVVICSMGAWSLGVLQISLKDLRRENSDSVAGKPS